MTSPTVRVSVVMPVYNGGELFRKTLDSLTGIVSTETEFIIVGDGSSDNTRELVESAMARDSRIRYIYQENSGAGPAKNNGLAEAKGEFLYSSSIAM